MHYFNNLAPLSVLANIAVVPFIGVLIGSVVSLAGLIRVERIAEHPILSGNFMARSSFILSVLALFLTQGLMQANMTNTIIFVNYTLPENTTIAGYSISVMYVGMSLGAVLLGPLADRYEPKKILAGSFLLTGIGCGILLLFTEITSVVFTVRTAAPALSRP